MEPQTVILSLLSSESDMKGSEREVKRFLPFTGYVYTKETVNCSMEDNKQIYEMERRLSLRKHFLRREESVQERKIEGKTRKIKVKRGRNKGIEIMSG